MAEIHVFNSKTETYEVRRGKLSAWWCQNEPTRGVYIDIERSDGRNEGIYFTKKEAGQVLKALVELLLQRPFSVDTT